MSGVVLDVPVASTQPRSFLRLLWGVLVGYFLAGVTLLIVALPLAALGVLPRPFARPSPFPVDGAWSLDADLVIAVFIVLVAAWFIRDQIAFAVRGEVSFGVVAFAVALTGFAPFLTLRPAALWGIVALPVTTWAIRRYAIGTALPFSRPSRRAWLALGLVGAAVVGSYTVYHPLEGTGTGWTGTLAHGRQFRQIQLKNSDWADLKILRVDGGWVGRTEGLLAPLPLPYTVRSRSEVAIYVVGRACVPRAVNITFSVLGRTSSQRFAVQPSSDSPGFHTPGDTSAC